MSDQIFIDPTPVSPRELSDVEMSKLQGGAAPVIWVTTCFETFGGAVAVAIVTLVEG